MMDLRVSVVLFIFLTGGYSLRCYTCHSDSMGHCNANEKTCSDGFSKCETRTAEICTTDCSKSTYTTKSCVAQCNKAPGVTVVHCCDTDLCNAADGVYKGSFLLLFSPLLFYFLFQ
ncbi:muscarinic toxin 38-like isoform X1 [Megalobrama amblycephala]|uniref:muscarinic toxin 38-like isoform X1 n=1 Tax=Megalobrama amblycephala TaxID=75352 RepID=UPI0020141B06|nr:muscarinic toxin 38-like isoform X1 [Megalobrama amblycephala]